MSILITSHRVNKLDACRSLPQDQGAEIDLRSWNEKIILNHEPFQNGPSLDEFLKIYKKDRPAPLILNPKEDGLEKQTIEKCHQYGIENYFFLDLPIPTLIRLVKQGFRKLALRISEYEPFEAAVRMKGMTLWVWLDCFLGSTPSPELVEKLQKLNYRICIVSPELQKYPLEKIHDHRQIVPYLRPEIDAVCTKYPKLWL